MAILIMVSTFGCINGYVLVGPRMYYAMAKEGLFLKKAGNLSSRGVPQWALWVQCIWSCVLCFSGTYGDLLDYATFASLLFYIVTIAGIFILRKREPDAERPYRAVGYPWVPALYIVCALAFCLNLLVFKPAFTIGSLVIVGLGAVVYLVTMRTPKALH
jgi:APA family basic amino acid/polyamine antiporter